MKEFGLIKAVIFDVDGTLVDSVDLHARAWVDAFEDFGHKTAFEDVRRQIGKGGDQLMPVFLTPREIDEKGEALEQHRGRVLKERYLPAVTAFPRVRDLFQRLLADGKRIGLASSAKSEELDVYKRIAGIVDLVQFETSSEDAEASKPHPDIFEAALKRLGSVDLDEVIVIGDTPYDAEAARRAGLRPIGVRCGGWSEAELKAAGCIAVFHDPADLLEQYDRSPLAR